MEVSTEKKGDNQVMQTTWTEYYTPDAATDRGWLKAITPPYDDSRWMEYTSGTMPVFDDDVNGWREQSTLGNYLDYGPVRPGQIATDGHVHAVCYASHASRYFHTVEQAKQWIEAEAQRVRPELEFQQSLFVGA